MDVDYVGRTLIVGIDEEGHERMMPLETDWVKVVKPTPLPNLWVNAYPTGEAYGWNTRARADGFARDGRMVLLHIWTDADGEDQMERMTP